MPYLNIRTNVAMGEGEQRVLLERVSQTVASVLGKPESHEPGRVYIEFSSLERHMWGWNGDTF